MRTTITQLVREQDRIHQRCMWRRMRQQDRLRAWAPVMLGAASLVALSIVGTVALVQAAAQALTRGHPMPHEVHASIQVLLPDDPSEMASTLSAVASAWATLLDEIEPVPCTPTFAVNETRTSRATRKSRTPRLVAVADDPQVA